MGAGSDTLCWYRLDERDRAKMDAMVKWKKQKMMDRNASPID